MHHDSAWKEVLEKLFEEFLAFFFPAIHRDIDFNKGFEFLDKELHKIARGHKTGRRVVDKLVKVFLKDGTEKWLLIHIEIQGYKQEGFPVRMYIYNYRAFDKFQQEVVGLALLTDSDPDFRPLEYSHSRWGCELVYRYPVVKILDYRDQLDKLETDNRPFAMIVSAYLRTLEASKNVQRKFAWKEA